MVKVAYICGQYPRFSETFIQREIKALRREGVHVLVFSVRRPLENEINQDADALEDALQTIYILPCNPFNLATKSISLMLRFPIRFCSTFYQAIFKEELSLKGRLFRIFYLFEAILFAHSILKGKVNWIHDHFAMASGSVAMFASRLTGIPFSTTLHGPHVFFDSSAYCLKEKLKYSKKVVCISHFSESQAKLFLARNDYHKIEIVHCGLDLSQYLPRYEKTSKLTEFISVCRLSIEKGIFDLLDSVRMLKDISKDFHLSIIGDGPLKSELNEYLVKEDLSQFVSLLGYKKPSEVSLLLRSHDVFVLPSYAEGLPVSIMEAMACGLAVISSSIAGCSEIVEHQKNGLLVPPSSPRHLFLAMQRLMEQPQMVEAMGIEGRRKVEEYFDINKEAKKLAAIFASSGG